MKLPVDELNSYHTARTGVSFYPQAEAGYLRIGGQDQENFLQRQTTNDVRMVTPGHTLATVLVTPNARILDVLRLIKKTDHLAALTLASHGASTAKFLQSRILFMDKVAVTDTRDDYLQLDLFGPRTAELMQRLGFAPVPLKDEITAGQINGAPVDIIAQLGLVGLGYRLVVERSKHTMVFSGLMAQGAVELSHRVYQILRIEAGLPIANAELTEAYTPLETGLRAAVHDAKGCYTGQEVIARQITYDKITQQLVGLRLESTSSPGARVSVGNKPVGRLTSYALSPRYGPVALAVIKRPYYKTGTLVVVGEQGIQATVIDLPF